MGFESVEIQPLALASLFVAAFLVSAGKSLAEKLVFSVSNMIQKKI